MFEPCFSPFSQCPSYTSPWANVNVILPWPCLLLFSNCPSYTFPLAPPGRALAVPQVILPLSLVHVPTGKPDSALALTQAILKLPLVHVPALVLALADLEGRARNEPRDMAQK